MYSINIFLVGTVCSIVTGLTLLHFPNPPPPSWAPAEIIAMRGKSPKKGPT